MATMAQRRLPDELALLAAVLWMVGVLWLFRNVDRPAPLAQFVLGAAWLAVMAAAAWGIGWCLWRGAGQDDAAGDGYGPAILLLGAGGLSLGAWGLAAVGWLRPTLLLVMLAAAAGLGFWRLLVGPRPRIPTQLPPLATVVLLVVALPTFLISLVDSPFYDQLHYHLAFPAQWLRAGTITMTPYSVYSHLPAQMGLLYVYGLSSFGPVAAQLIHWAAGVVVVVVAALIAHRFNPSAAALTAAMLAATPAVFIMSTWAAADLGVAAWGAGALLLALRAVDGRGGRGLWLLIGLLCGLAAAAKYLAILTVVVPIALALAIVGDRKPLRDILVRWGFLAFGLAIPLAPWLAQNWWSTGDPVFPYLAAVFPMKEPNIAAGLAHHVGALALGGAPSALTLGTFSPRGEAGLIGAVHLLLLPFALFFLLRERSRPAVMVGVVALLGGAGWALSPQLGRYVVPVLVPLDVLAAAGLVAALGRAAPIIRRGLIVLVGLTLAWSLQGAFTDTGMYRLAAAVGAASGNHLMERYVTYWDILPALHRNVGPGDLLLLVGESRTLYMDRPVLAQDPFQTPLLVRLAEQTKSTRGIATGLRHLGVTYVLVNRAEEERVAQLLGRERYLQPEGPQARAALARFFTQALVPAASAGPCTLYRLKGRSHE